MDNNASAILIQQAETAFKSANEHLESELSKLRTGRANANMLDGLMIEAYGVQMPLNQVGTVTAPEAQLIQITPFDPNNLAAISTAIRNNQALGFNPSDDGRVVRIVVPLLTEERRKEIAKQIGEKVEEALVRMRSARRDVLKQVETAKKDKQLSEDEARRIEKAIDENLNSHRLKIETTAKSKETEILTL
jgi:ribosome recycling factor